MNKTTIICKPVIWNVSHARRQIGITIIGNQSIDNVKISRQGVTWNVRVWQKLILCTFFGCYELQKNNRTCSANRLINLLQSIRSAKFPKPCCPQRYAFNGARQVKFITSCASVLYNNYRLLQQKLSFEIIFLQFVKFSQSFRMISFISFF